MPKAETRASSRGNF
jgi:hypothetical protein